MKKLSMLFSAVMLLCMASCDYLNKPLAEYDMVYLNGGKMYFYNFDSNKNKEYRGERDSVVNVAYSNNDVLYYSVAVNNNLILKSLDLKQKNAKPQKMVDWGLTLKDCESYKTANPGLMRFDKAGTQLGMGSDMVFDYYQFSKYSIYHTLDKKIRNHTVFTYDPETGDFDINDEYMDYKPYYYSKVKYNDFEFNRLGKLFYLDGDQRVSLTDQFNYAELFQLEEEEAATYVEMNPISIDPQRSKVLYSAMLPWNDLNYGIYCVSSLDGNTQMPLYSKMTYTQPEWVKNGSLVFVSQQQDNEGNFVMDATGNPVLVVKVLHPDWTVVTAGVGNDFAVRPLY